MKKIFKQLFFALCLFAAPLGVDAQTLVFHLAGGEKTTVTLPATFTVTPTDDKLVIDDGSGNVVELSKDDVMCVTYRDAKGDVNGDQRVDVADVSTLVGMIISSGGGDTPSSGDGGDTPSTGDDDDPSSSGNAPDGVVAVDLGLPSGTKWANMNVGATAQNEWGLYFAWGETVGYSGSATNDGRSFDWASYKWMTEGTASPYWINKYQTADNQTEACWYDMNYQFIGDGKTELTPADDAAHANWGGDWYMPTIADFEELLNNTTSEWTELKGVKGRKFTSKKNGNAIFLPAAGLRNLLGLHDSGDGTWGFYLPSLLGAYWSLSLSTTSTFKARGLYYDSDGAYVVDKGFSDRFYGRSVRPVLRK